MARIDRTRYLNKEKYTLYGRLFLLFCAYLGVDQQEVARRMDLDPGAVSKHITVGKNEPERDTVKRAIAALRVIAQEKNIMWDEQWEELLMHGAGRATDSEMMIAESGLDSLIATVAPKR